MRKPNALTVSIAFSRRYVWSKIWITIFIALALSGCASQLKIPNSDKPKFTYTIGSIASEEGKIKDIAAIPDNDYVYACTDKGYLLKIDYNN